jgi:hypothetical protein
MKLDANVIIQKLKASKKVKDYSLIIAFFIVFSIFVWFAIRPNIITAFSLQQELKELKEKDAHYEEVIMSIVEFQSKLEMNRDRLDLLDQALPPDPHVHKTVTDIMDAADDANIEVLSLDLRETELIDNSDKEEDSNNNESYEDVLGVEDKFLAQAEEEEMEDEGSVIIDVKAETNVKDYILSINAQASEKAFAQFLEEVENQRRLKLFSQVVLDPKGGEEVQNTASGSAVMQVQFEVKGKYL